MSEIDILQRSLDCGLFQIGDADDIRFEKLRKAADALSTQLSAEPHLAVSFSLAAFDPEVPLDDPTLSRTAAAVQAEWQTYRARYADVPRSLFQALLLHALYEQIQSDARIAVIVSLIAKNLIPVRSFGVATGVVSDVVLMARQVVETTAEGAWSVPSSASVKTDEVKRPKLSFPSMTTASVDQAWLTQALNDAANGNPYNGYQQPGPYAQHLAKSLALPIAQAIDASVEATGVSTELVKKELLDPLAAYLTEMRGAVKKAVSEIHESSSALRLTNQLIWWKEAAYSSSTKCGYGELPPFVAAIIMAVDLSLQVPIFFPESVEYFLLGAANVLASDSSLQNEQITLTDALNAACGTKEYQFVREALSLQRSDGASSRCLLIEYLAESADASSSAEALALRVGIDPALPMTPAKLTLWLFRELEAKRTAAGAKTEAAE